MTEGRFAFVCSVKEFILEKENKNTPQKTGRDVIFLEISLKTKEEFRKIEDIYDNIEYEPTSLRS